MSNKYNLLWNLTFLEKFVRCTFAEFLQDMLRCVNYSLFSLFPLSCWTCVCWTCIAWSFPTASSLLQPCFTSPLWRWWRTFQVRNQLMLNEQIELSAFTFPSLCFPGCFTLTQISDHLSVHTALKRVEVEECVRWMVPFAMALREVGGSPMKTFSGISADDMHNIQTHVSYLTWLVSDPGLLHSLNMIRTPWKIPVTCTYDHMVIWWQHS